MEQSHNNVWRVERDIQEVCIKATDMEGNVTVINVHQ